LKKRLRGDGLFSLQALFLDDRAGIPGDSSSEVNCPFSFCYSLFLLFFPSGMYAVFVRYVSVRFA
jgi:hypothetical protein